MRDITGHAFRIAQFLHEILSLLAQSSQEETCKTNRTREEVRISRATRSGSQI